MNLAEGLQQEIARNYQLLETYKQIPAGHVGATLIQIDLNKAHKAIANDDIIEQMRIYDILKNNK